MTIPRLNGWWDEIAPSFQKFSEKLPDIVHPNRKYLQGVREALAMNPQLMQQYADMEAQTPGILDKMGLGGLVAPARTMGASSQLIGERKKREVLSKKLTPEKEAEVEANILGIKTERENKAIDVDTSYKQALTDYQKLTTDIANETRAGRLAEAKMKEAELSAYNNALPIVNRLAQNKLSPFRAYINKQLSPEESAAVMAVPSFKAAWQAEFDIWRGQQEDAYRRERNAIDRSNIRINSTEEQLSKERAKIASAVSAFTGESIDNVFAYQSLDQQRKLILENAQDPSKLNPQEQALWRGMKAVKDYSAKMGRKEAQLGLNSSRSLLSSLVKTITGNGDREQKKAAISMYNSEMERIFGPLVEMGIEKGVPTIMYEPSKWRGNVKDLTMINATSESMEAAHSIGLMVTPKTQELQNRMGAQVSNSTGLSNEDLAFAVDKLKELKQSGNTQDYLRNLAELEGAFGKDVIKNALKGDTLVTKPQPTIDPFKSKNTDTTGTGLLSSLSSTPIPTTIKLSPVTQQVIKDTVVRNKAQLDSIVKNSHLFQMLEVPEVDTAATVEAELKKRFPKAFKALQEQGFDSTSAVELLRKHILNNVRRGAR